MYAARRINDQVVLGLAVNSPFGLGTDLKDPDSAFAMHHRKASLLTFNVNPIISYEVSPGLIIAGGAQIELAKLRFESAFGAPPGPTSLLHGDDVGFGFTAGLLWKPNEGTSIGLGYRSKISHAIEGNFSVAGVLAPTKFSLDIDTPEIVTLSLRHAVSPTARILATVEWTHWDRLNVHPVTVSGLGVIGNFDFQWEDGWFFALGGEYDHSDKLTLRTGVALEQSPIRNPTQRLVQTPDSDRIWLSFGGTYKYSETTSLDFGYSHVFFHDATLDRLPLNGNPGLRLVAGVESSANIFSASIKFKR